MVAAILGQIAESFTDVPRPSDITKSVARALDDDWTVGEERRTILRNQDSEVLWTDLADEDIEAYDDIFPFLDAEGFRFYLPAFMSYALRRYQDSRSATLDSVIPSCAAFPNRFALFTPAQMHCAVGFFTFWAAHEESPSSEWAAYLVDYIERNGLSS